MRTSVKNIMAATAGLAMVGAAGSASAATFGTITQELGVTQSVNTTGNTVTFDYTQNAESYATIVFSTTSTFDLVVSNYRPTSGGSIRSGYTLYDSDAATVLTTDEPTACNAAGPCNLVSSASTGVAFTGLAPGNYLLGFYEFGQSNGAGATFEIAEAAVPLPAAFGFLAAGVAGLGVAGASRKRRNKA